MRGRDAPLLAPLTMAQGSRLALASYRMLANRPRLFLRLAGPWVLIGGITAAVDPPWADAVSVGIIWLASVAISVAWCRLILVSAPCPLGGRLGRRELRYLIAGLPMIAAALLVMTILLVLTAAVAPVVYKIALDDALASPWVTWPIGEVGMLAFLVAISRFQLVFPAIAVDDRSMTFRSSRRLTRGSTLAISTGSVIASVPVLFPTVSWWLPVVTPQTLALVVSNGLDYLTTAVSAAVIAGFCAQLYRRQFGSVTAIFD